MSINWKPIIGYEDAYEVSDTGIVRSIQRKVRNSNNGTYRIVKEKVLKTCIWGTYQMVMLSHTQSRSTRYQVHRLVGIHFIPNPLSLPQINHIDGNKMNNHVDNLEWCTQSHNLKEAYRLGLSKTWNAGTKGIVNIGESSGQSKLKNFQVHEIRDLYLTGNYSTRKLGELFKVSDSTISNILKGKTWAVITGGEDISLLARTGCRHPRKVYDN